MARRSESNLALSEPEKPADENEVKRRRQMRYAATPRLYPFLQEAI